MIELINIRVKVSISGTSGNIKDLLKVSGTFQEHVLSHPGSLCQFSQNQVLRLDYFLIDTMLRK